jgi:hypothetical protein
VPASSSLIAAITTIIFLATAVVATLLTVSTSSLLASGAIPRPSSYMISEPSRNLLVRRPLAQAFHGHSNIQQYADGQFGVVKISENGMPHPNLCSVEMAVG